VSDHETPLVTAVTLNTVAVSALVAELRAQRESPWLTLQDVSRTAIAAVVGASFGGLAWLVLS
jgi:hypothetical protein